MDYCLFLIHYWLAIVFNDLLTENLLSISHISRQKVLSRNQFYRRNDLQKFYNPQEIFGMSDSERLDFLKKKNSGAIQS